MKHAGILIVLIVFGMSNTASAEEWAIVGARNLGMGGTGVACARGAAAYYWNPALYAIKEENAMFLPMGVGLAVEGDLIEKADFLSKRLEEIDLEALQNDLDNPTPASIDATDFHNAFEVLLIDIPMLADYGTGITTNVNLGLTSRWGNYGVSLMGLGYGGARPVVNLALSGGIALSDDEIGIALGLLTDYGNHTPTGLNDLSIRGNALSAAIEADFGVTVENASTFVYMLETTPPNPNGAVVDLNNPVTYDTAYSIAQATFTNDGSQVYDVMLDNLSGVDINLVKTQEIGFTYARALASDWTVGANIKGVIAETYVTRVVVSQLDDGETIAGQVTDFSYDPVTSRRLAIDVGAMYSVADDLQVGLTVRNFNQPNFSFEGESNGFTLYSQTRAGLLWQATETVALAADLDLFPNLSEVLDGLKTQFVCTGMEWTPCSWWAFRMGMYKNIALAEEGLVYTMGMGFTIGTFFLDFAGSLGFSDVKVETEEIGIDVYVPERGNFMLSMGLNFNF